MIFGQLSFFTFPILNQVNLSLMLLLSLHRIRGIGKSFDSLGESVFAESSKLSFKPVSDSKSKYERSTSVYFQNEGRMETPVFLLEKLERGDLVKGPAIIIDRTQTLVVDPEAEAKITSKHVWIELNVEKSKKH